MLPLVANRNNNNSTLVKVFDFDKFHFGETLEDVQNLSSIDPDFMNYSYMQKYEEAQQSQDDDDEQLEGPTGSKRKRAFSSCALAPTTNTMTTSNNAMSNMPTTSENMTNGAGQAGEKRAATKICRVCGDKAYSYNFNVITCESCKAFFRRNANKIKVCIF